MPNVDAVNIVLISGEYSKIHAAATFAMVGASYGLPVKIFVSMEALPAFHKDGYSGKISMGPVAQKIEESGGEDFASLFRQAKDFGDVTLYACGLVMDLYHWSLSDLIDVFDDTMGVAGYFAITEGEKALTF